MSNNQAPQPPTSNLSLSAVEEPTCPVDNAAFEPLSIGRQLLTTLRPGLTVVIALTLITGVIYPLALTGIGSTLFPHQASGSLIRSERGVLGSELIGQAFAEPGSFWGRPSSTGPAPYNAAASAGSNFGPVNPALRKVVQERIAALRAGDPANRLPIPVDLVTASGSGLDPDISPAAARYQVSRIARARGVPESAVTALVERQIQGRRLGFLGEPRVNVLALNRALATVRPDEKAAQ